MTDVPHNPATPPPEDDLLDQIVQDHLAQAPATTPTTELPPAGTGAQDLQNEIQALLGTAPPPSAIRRAPTATPPGLEPVQILDAPSSSTDAPKIPSTPPPGASLPPAISAAELDALLSTPTPETDEATALSATAATSLADGTVGEVVEVEEQVSAAQSGLSEELAARADSVAENLLPTPAPTPAAMPATEHPAPSSPSANPTPEAAAGVTPDETAALHQPHDPAPSQPAAPHNSLPHDLALMLAQLIDMPFAWLSAGSKQLIGLAATLLLLTGLLLLVVSHLQK